MRPYEPAQTEVGDASLSAAQEALQDYSNLVEASEMSDVVFVVEGHRFHAHRLVLQTRSLYL